MSALPVPHVCETIFLPANVAVYNAEREALNCRCKAWGVDGHTKRRAHDELLRAMQAGVSRGEAYRLASDVLRHAGYGNRIKNAPIAG